MRFVLFLVLLLSGMLSRGTSAEALSCAGGIVSEGDRVADLIIKCGQPAWKDAHLEEVFGTYDWSLGRKTTIMVEEWTYNLGPQQFLRIITIRNGRVSTIRTGGYGAAPDSLPRGPGCGDRVISTGEKKAEVILKCGEPFYKDVRVEEVLDWVDNGRLAKVSVTIEEWTYNFGPNRFMRIITFRNGTVVDIQTGGYGR